MATIFTKAQINQQSRFVEDIKRFENLSHDEIAVVTQQLSRYLIDDEQNDDEPFIEGLAKSIDQNYSTTRNLIDISKFLIVHLGPNGKAENDSSEDLAQDLVELEIINQSKQKFFKDVFDVIRENLPQSFADRITSAAQMSEGIPRLLKIETTVNLRGVVNEKFSEGDDLLKYNPSIRKLVTYATVQIETSDSPPIDTITFQADARKLKLIIDRLNATLIELNAIDEVSNRLEHK